MRTMMKCGHAANAHNADTGEPSCVICIGLDPGATEVDDNPPSLEGRMAHCCGKRLTPSDGSQERWGGVLPFFEMAEAQRCRTCLAAEYWHSDEGRAEAQRGRGFKACDAYDPAWIDSYYCGHSGWD